MEHGRPRRPTAADVARLSGVSRATVSYVLNNHPGQTISDATIERVRDAATRIGYIPSAAAAALRRGHSQIVLVVIDPMYSGYVSERFLAGVVDRLAAEGYVVFTHSLVSEEALVAAARSIQPYGVVSLSFTTRATKDLLRGAGVRHIVGFDTPEAGYGEPDRPWEESLGRAQAAYALDRGYRDLVYVTPTASVRQPIARARLRGARELCRERGAAEPTLLEVPLDRAGVAAAIDALGPIGRVAFCAYDDELAIAVLAGLADLGRSVPADAAVIGADDTPVSALVTPALTTVDIDVARLGRDAAEWFLAMTADPAAPSIEAPSLPITVVERDSA